MKHNAILLVGPTGSGKTPLGEQLEQLGLPGFDLRHLDFGACLRTVTTKPGSTTLNTEEIRLIKSLLDAGALLENDTFYLAEKVVANFIGEQRSENLLIVLNGLPRHVDQARDVSRIFNIIHLLVLDCSAETVIERIEKNAGADRSGRTDDQLSLINTKLKTYQERTLPLIDWYARQQIPVTRIPVTLDTTPLAIIKLFSPQFSSHHK